MLLIAVIRDARQDGRLAAPDERRPLTPVLADQAAALAAASRAGTAAAALVSAIIAWTQLFGMISFELFGQFVGSVDPSDEFFAAAVERMADLVGLPN